MFIARKKKNPPAQLRGAELILIVNTQVSFRSS